MVGVTILSSLITINLSKGNKELTTTIIEPKNNEYTSTMVSETEVKVEIAEVILPTSTISPYVTETEELKNMGLSPKDYLLKFKEIATKYSENYESIYDVYSADEIYLIQRCIQTETNQCGSFIARCNVASVILNRLNSDLFPNSVKEVITNKGQFAYWRTEIEEDTKLSLEYVYMFGDTTNGCIGFHSNNKTETFCGWQFQFTDDIGHNFYK